VAERERAVEEGGGKENRGRGGGETGGGGEHDLSVISDEMMGEMMRCD
jgi:hypothetical protein